MLNKNNKKKRIAPSVTTAICAFVMLIGGFFLSYNYVQSKKVMAYDYMANVFYTNKDYNIIEQEGTEREEPKETTNEDTSNVTNEYIGYLNIPKINLWIYYSICIIIEAILILLVVIFL